MSKELKKETFIATIQIAASIYLKTAGCARIVIPKETYELMKLTRGQKVRVTIETIS